MNSDEDGVSVVHTNDKFQKIYESMTTLELIRAMAKVRAEKDNLDMELKGVTAEHEYLSKIAIPEKFAGEGIKNMRVEGIGRISLRPDIYASVKAGRKERAYLWLKDIGSGSLIQDSVPPSTLKAFLKARIISGDEIPEDLFNATAYTVATITKG